MGISHSTARIIAPLSFAFDFAAQQYGIFSKPNMQDIHYQNLAAFSPRPEFIGGFFFPQQIFQLVWLYKLWKGPASCTKDELDQMVDYTPFYALGNVCIGSELNIFKESQEQKVDLVQRGCSSGTQMSLRQPTSSSSSTQYLS